MCRRVQCVAQDATPGSPLRALACMRSTRCEGSPLRALACMCRRVQCVAQDATTASPLRAHEDEEQEVVGEDGGCPKAACRALVLALSTPQVVFFSAHYHVCSMRAAFLDQRKKVTGTAARGARGGARERLTGEGTPGTDLLPQARRPGDRPAAAGAPRGPRSACAFPKLPACEAKEKCICGCLMRKAALHKMRNTRCEALGVKARHCEYWLACS